jgi:hypothetical protein
MQKSDISYQEKLNELRLDISHPNSSGISFILLEGETDCTSSSSLGQVLNKTK